MNGRRHSITVVLLGVLLGPLAWVVEAAEGRPDPKELLALALTASGAITDEDEKDDALIRIIHAQAFTGDIAGAEKTAKAIRADQKKGFASRAIAAGYARAGDIKSATALAQAPANAKAKSGILEEIVAALVEKGDLAAAKAARAQIQDAFYGAHANRRIAIAQAAAGDVAAAKQTVAGIKGPADVKVEGYLGIAESLLKAKNAAGAKEMIETAKATAQQVPDYLRPLSVAAIAAMQVKAGDARTAMATANRIAEPGDKALALLRIATAQAEIGDVAGSKATARLLTGGDQVRLQVMFARGQMKGGDKAGATQSLAAARKLADGIEIPTLRAYAYETLLEAQVELGDAGRAAELAKAQKDPIVRTYSLAAVVRAMAKK